MYELIIQTTYNVIRLVVDDYKTPEIQEIFEQPYVIDVKINEIKEPIKVKKRKKEG